MKPVTFLQRLLAFVYDSFIVFSVLLLATALALLLNHGQPLTPYRFVFIIYLLISTGLFLSWFWQRSGQTLGMLAWKIKLVAAHENKITWQKGLMRFMLAFLLIGLAGIGLWWCLFDKDKQALYDRILGLKLIKVLKPI